MCYSTFSSPDTASPVMHFSLPPLPDLIRSLGYFGVWAFVFAESSIIFFLPGDSLLFTAGFLTSQGFLNLWLLIFGCFICAVLGNSLGYLTGEKLGKILFANGGNWLFREKHLFAARDFFERHGNKAIVLARFMPAIRTFAPIVAGMTVMERKKFSFYNILGGFIWTFGLTIAGYFLGKVIPDVDKYLLPIIVGIIVLSLLPSLIHLYAARGKSRK
ncbi:VTT domain-containing protein [Pannus brasiliensis CCIBt3594]|uniref:VTT domain-containing protein n=1 Tax=Pannus brasiliensis CCIBt3594 TaxID=1427578 RepID=A0AAW9QU86_9CHRO